MPPVVQIVVAILGTNTDTIIIFFYKNIFIGGRMTVAIALVNGKGGGKKPSMSRAIATK